MTIRVELVAGLGEDYDPGPGRLLLVGPDHTFADLAEAIEVAFARWDRAHLHQFILADGRRIGEPSIEDEPGHEPLDEQALLVTSTLEFGDRFAYLFDLGDRWLHHCEAVDDDVDPDGAYGTIPTSIVPIWGWGQLPDQYERRWDGDDGQEDWPPGHEVDDDHVAIRVAGVDVRIYRDGIEGRHAVDARLAALPGSPSPRRSGRPAAGRLIQATDNLAMVEIPVPPAWLAELADDPSPLRPRTLQRHGAGVTILIPQPARRDLLLPWLAAQRQQQPRG